jgi:hypothetical protein
MMPAPLQTTQLVARKQDGHKYITINDKSTQSFVDFACKKLMWLMALVAAVIAVCVVATGGAALIAIGAIAGAAGAVFGAVVGSLICGQKAAMARHWIGQKDNLKVLGTPTVTGANKMVCTIFNEQITFAPNIKSWWQAVALGAANFVGGVLQGAMVGAAVGGGAALIQGGIAALAEGGVSGLGRGALQLVRTLPGNVVGNVVSSWTTGLGLGLRGLLGAQNVAATYGQTGQAGVGDFASGAVSMETGTAESAKNVFTGQGTASDYLGLALWMVPVHESTKPKATPAEEGGGGGKGNGDGDGKPAEDEAPKSDGGQGDNPPDSNGGEAYEDGPRYGDRKISDDLYDELRDQTPTQEIRDMVNRGKTFPAPDEALPGKTVTKRLHADHIVSMDKITRMDGFDKLTKEQQLAVLNNPANFQGLSESANTSKGAKSYEDWTLYKKENIAVDPTFRANMMAKEQSLQGDLQKQIDNFNKQNQANAAAAQAGQAGEAGTQNTGAPDGAPDN